MKQTTWFFVAVGAVFLGLEPVSAQESKAVTIDLTKTHADFRIGQQLVARYDFGPQRSKPIFWPIKAPGGVIVTRAYPMESAAEGGSKDHEHHQSVWFCWGDVIPEGIELKDKLKNIKGVDFWSVHKGHGRIVCTSCQPPKLGKGQASLATENEWRTADGVPVLHENRLVTLHDLGQAWLFVLDIDLHARYAPITFGDTKEGGMAIRVHDQIRGGKGGKGKIQNAEGLVGEKGTWGKISAWSDYSGPIDGKVAGITIMSDPKNLYPACFHSRDYGLNAANPFGRKRAFPIMKDRTDLAQIAKDGHLHLRYGVLLHGGDADAGQVAAHYQRFVSLRAKD